MMKSAFFIATLLTAHLAQAALTVNCDVWGRKDTDPTLDVMMTTPFTAGRKFDSMPVSPSTLTVIEKQYSEGRGVKQNVIFNDAISHLNQKSSNGIFELVDSKIYPIRKDSDILHPSPETVKMRHMKLNLEMLEQEKGSTERIDLSSLSFDVKQLSPGDATFIGEGSIAYNGKTYIGLSYRCHVAVSLSVVEQLLEKKK